MFAVCVTFQIQPNHMADFIPLMQQQAKNSLELESGCHQFDICTDEERPNEVFLYEIYDDAEAFQIHLASEHFKSFDLSVKNMLANKQVITYGRVIQ